VVYGMPGGGAMSAQEMLAQLDRQRLARLAPVLVEGESPVAMVPAQSVRLAERRGRGGGEGVLHLTTARLVFVDDQSGPAFHIPLPLVTGVTTNRIAVPKMRALKVSYDGLTDTFWTGKRFADLMRNAIHLNR
jgi:hypothetical protein